MSDESDTASILEGSFNSRLNNIGQVSQVISGSILDCSSNSRFNNIGQVSQVISGSILDCRITSNNIDQVC